MNPSRQSRATLVKGRSANAFSSRVVAGLSASAIVLGFDPLAEGWVTEASAATSISSRRWTTL